MVSASDESGQVSGQLVRDLGARTRGTFVAPMAPPAEGVIMLTAATEPPTVPTATVPATSRSRRRPRTRFALSIARSED